MEVGDEVSRAVLDYLQERGFLKDDLSGLTLVSLERELARVADEMIEPYQNEFNF